MKHFKIGFLAIIALVAMSFTYLSSSDIYKTMSGGTCDNNQPFTYAASTVTIGSNTFDETSDCVDLVGQCAVFVPVDDITCPGGNKFCCAELQDDQQCTPPSKLITKVFCKE